MHMLEMTVQEVIDEQGIVAEVLPCDPDFADTAAFCEKYGIDLHDSANTILVASKKVDPIRCAVCVVLATTRLDVNTKVCELLEVKKASFADAEATKQMTGMMIGGVTAIGIRQLPVYIDAAVMQQQRIIMGGGNRSSKLVLNPQELTKLPNAVIIEGLARPTEG